MVLRGSKSQAPGRVHGQAELRLDAAARAARGRLAAGQGARALTWPCRCWISSNSRPVGTGQALILLCAPPCIFLAVSALLSFKPHFQLGAGCGSESILVPSYWIIYWLFLNL